MFEEFLEGKTGTSLLSVTDNAETVLRMGTKWLTEFIMHLQPFCSRKPSEKYDALSTFITDPYANEYGRNFIEDDTLFIGPTHNDFTASNILIDTEMQAVSGVIDFEYFTAFSMPMHDLVSLIFETGCRLYGQNEKAIQKTFFEDCYLSRAIDTCVTSFCTSIDIEKESFKSILPISAEISMEVIQRWERSGDLTSLHRTLRDELKDDIESVVWI